MAKNLSLLNSQIDKWFYKDPCGCGLQDITYSHQMSASLLENYRIIGRTTPSVVLTKDYLSKVLALPGFGRGALEADG